MTAADQGAGRAAVERRIDVWRSEIAATTRLALPIALTQLGQITMMTTDLMLVGRLGDAAMAAAALGQTLMFSIFLVGMGLIAAVAPLAAQGYGARDPRLVRRALRVGLWAAVLLGIPLTVLLLNGETILLAFGQDAALAALAGRYLEGLAFSLVPAWSFLAIRNFMGAVNRPEPAFWITLAAVPVNVAIAYALIHGALGLPRLGLLGAGLATTVVSIGMCGAAMVICVRNRPFRKYQVLARLWRPDWPLFGRLIVIGAPIAGAFTLEQGFFAAATLMMGWIGTVALAAHQIALQTAAVLFMVPFGVSMAATVRVGHAVGRRDPAGTRRAGLAAVAVGIIFMAVMTVIVALARHLIPLAFLGLAADPAAVALAATLLLMGSTFFIADGVQSIAAGALRGLNDTRVPLLFAALSFWVIGFGATYGFAFMAGWHAIGIWIGLSLGLFVYATLLVRRFHRLTRRAYLPGLASAPAPHTRPSRVAPAGGSGA